MPTNPAKLASYILLACATAFSATSISTPYYFETQHVSGLECQGGANLYNWGEPLGYLPRGAVNRSEEYGAIAVCPLTIPETGYYNVNTLLFSRVSKDNDITCNLIEIDVTTGLRVRTYTETAHVSGNSTGLLTWWDITRTVTDSVFTVSCGLLPGTGVTSISVAAT